MCYALGLFKPLSGDNPLQRFASPSQVHQVPGVDAAALTDAHGVYQGVISAEATKNPMVLCLSSCELDNIVLTSTSVKLVRNVVYLRFI